MTKFCLLTGVPITDANDSRAHIVPSALGGRLKPKGLICAGANTILGDAVDLPLIRAFEPIMSHLDGSRDRGTNPAVRMTDEAGRDYRFRFGAALQLTRPEFSMFDQPDGSVEVSVSARSVDELRTLLGRVKARFAEFDIEAAVGEAELIRTRPTGKLRHQLQVGPAVTFPAAYVAASLYAAQMGFAPHPDFAAYVGSITPGTAAALPPDTFLWHNPAWFKVDARISHVVALIGDPAAGRMMAFVEYFNIACVALLLPFTGTEPYRATYAVDVLTGKTANVTIDETMLATLPWSATHMLADQTLLDDMAKRTGRVVGIAQERGRGAAIEQIFEEVAGPVDGRLLTQAEKAELQRKLGDFIADQLRDR